QFQSTSGAHIQGWYGHHKRAVASVMLLHGVRSDRREMQSRALFLHQQQMNVLLFDFQAHGESRGEAITFGYREARDVEAAFQFLQKQAGAVPIGALGFSLGGAAVLLSRLPQQLDFLIVEAVYPDIETAIRNRLVMRLGKVGAILTPLLSWQLRWRLAIDADQLRPIAGLQSLRCPLLVIGGSDDRRTSLADSMRMFDVATVPKSLWILDGARHENFYAYAPDEYERRVLAFINQSTGL
ncbi:MAG: alpha/beta fold hydrolase, partial [bacterium]|nr:alpha/beta fold hydrolase [bacterium]